MRVPFVSWFKSSPFEGLLEHAEKIKECAWAFQQAIECHISDKCAIFEQYRSEVDKLESEADAIKQRIRGHLPKVILMPVDKLELFRYLHEQDKVLDAIEGALDWLSFRPEPGIPRTLEKDFFLLVDAVLDPVEEMCQMVSEACTYFRHFSAKRRATIKDIIQALRRHEHNADKVEDAIKAKALNMPIDAITVLHVVRLAETIGAIADHAENAGDMMQAMLGR